MTKFEYLKQKLIRRGIFFGVVVVVVVVIYTSLTIKKTSLDNDLEKLSQASMSLINKATSSQEKNQLIVESLDFYQNLPDNKVISIDLKDLVSRIRAARTLKENLELRYKLKDLTMKFTPIEEVTKEFETKFVSIYSSNLEVEFEALTDEIVLSFCHSIIREAPGYLNIESLEISKGEEITREILAMVRNRNKEIPSLVKAKIVFNWRTLEVNKPDNETTKGGRRL